MSRNEISVDPFDEGEFATALLAASDATSENIPDQIGYLARYCNGLNAASVVREEHYVDRHFVDEFVLYYSRTLRPPRNAVRRFHLFSIPFTNDAFSAMLVKSMTSTADADEVRSRLQDAYLGFISIRPIPSVPVGRTVLKRWEDSHPVRRQVWATSTHHVHLANIKLSVTGLAFQQQDVAVGACATAALWSALSRVARSEGMRAPTPAEVSEAASRHLLPNGRSLPATGGLTMQQLSEAIRSCGFAPEAMRADKQPEYFVAGLHAYLLSGLPVVLGLRRPGVGHAVTAVGYQDDSSVHPMLQATIPVRSASLKKLYVHDDRIGPYARAYLTPFFHKEAGEGLLFQIETETWLVDSALVPVYPKLRLSVRSLITLANLTQAVVEEMVGPSQAADLSVDFYYERSGDYLSKLVGQPVAPSPQFLRRISLSRWCAIVRWYLSNVPLVEFVYDTTDILRDRERLGGELLRGIVALAPLAALNVGVLAETYGVRASTET